MPITSEREQAILAARLSLVRARSWLRTVTPTPGARVTLDASEEYITAAIQSCADLLRVKRTP